MRTSECIKFDSKDIFGAFLFGSRIVQSCALVNYFSIFVQFFPPNGPSIFPHHDSPSNLAESWYDGTGTRPDYLVNRDDKKMRGSSGKKIALKSRNNCTVNSRSCGCTRTADIEHNFAQS